MFGSILDAMEGIAKKRGNAFKGTAKFVGPNSVEVDSNTPTGNHIIIATGSKPRPLPIPGAALTITSDEVLS